MVPNIVKRPQDARASAVRILLYNITPTGMRTASCKQSKRHLNATALAGGNIHRVRLESLIDGKTFNLVSFRYYQCFTSEWYGFQLNKKSQIMCLDVVSADVIGSGSKQVLLSAVLSAGLEV